MKSLLQVSRLKKSYGARTLFEEATASFGERQKIGVVGRNGAGKSTLFKIILGQEEADEGEVIQSQDLRLGYLEQHAPYEPGENALDFLQRYTEREAWACGKIAGRFQLKNELLEQPLETLPGGYQMRVKLAAMLLREPNFLMLDEPTNYLDLNTLLLLERFLQGFKGGYLIISHDREFLKKTCDHTLEVEDGDVFLFPGPLEDYFEFKEEQQEQKLRLNRNIESRRKELESFVTRFRAKASKAAQAQSRMKQLEKLETIEIKHSFRGVNMRIPAVETRKGVALRCEGLAIGYENRPVAAGIDLEIGRGQHVALLGDNGQGKSTLLKTIAELIPARGGTFRWMPNLRVAFYAQHVYSALHPGDDVYMALERYAAPGTPRQEILSMAGGFLFSGDDVKKPVANLSGGERARVCLAGLLLSKSDVLLLDEPTNHLDFDTVEALGRALANWNGTVIFVSHDRTFVKLAATAIVEISNGEVNAYHGPYDEYVYSLELRIERELGEERGGRNGAAAGREKNKSAPVAAAEPAAGGLSRDMRKGFQNQLNHAKKQLRTVEPRLRALEAEHKALQEYFAAGGAYVREKQERLDALAGEIAAAENEWLQAQSDIEELERRLSAAAG